MTKIRSINQHGEFGEFDQFDDDLPDTAPDLPDTAPGVVTDFQVIPGESGITVIWNSPANDVLQPVTGYYLQIWKEGGEDPETQSPLIRTPYIEGMSVNMTMNIDEMDPGKHVVKIAAVNPVGTGDYATLSTTVTPATNAQFPTPQILKLPLRILKNPFKNL